jgi:hypothetical protein
MDHDRLPPRPGRQGSHRPPAGPTKAVPAERALAAPGLRLVATDADGSTSVVASLPVGAFMPCAPVSTAKVEAGRASKHAALRAARHAITAEHHGPPLAIFACSVADVPGVMASDGLALAYALGLGDTESFLPWWESQGVAKNHGDYCTLIAEDYRRELAQALLLTTRPDIAAPVRVTADRLQRLADDIERLAAPALGEAAALGCPDPVLRTLRAPLGALISALRAATEDRLLRQTRAGELALAALDGAFTADPGIGDEGERETSPAERHPPSTPARPDARGGQ